MSARNGDKSRFHRQRKKRIEQRKTNREMAKAAGSKPAHAKQA